MKQIIDNLFRVLLIVFFLTSGNIVAQQKNTDNIIILNVAPLALVDYFDGASLRFGAEFKIKNNISFTIENGQYLRYLKSTKINPSGYLIRPSLKYYLNRNHCYGKFIALEYQYKNQHYDLRDSIEYSSINFDKQYSMQRIVHFVVFKYGNMINFGKNFIFEWYAGIGIRYIRSYSSLTEEEKNSIIPDSECPIQKDFIRQSGTLLYPDFKAGIKIGYKIK